MRCSIFRSIGMQWPLMPVKLTSMLSHMMSLCVVILHSNELVWKNEIRLTWTQVSKSWGCGGNKGFWSSSCWNLHYRRSLQGSLEYLWSDQSLPLTLYKQPLGCVRDYGWGDGDYGEQYQYRLLQWLWCGWEWFGQQFQVVYLVKDLMQ